MNTYGCHVRANYHLNELSDPQFLNCRDAVPGVLDRGEKDRQTDYLGNHKAKDKTTFKIISIGNDQPHLKLH